MSSSGYNISITGDSNDSDLVLGSASGVITENAVANLATLETKTATLETKTATLETKTATLETKTATLETNVSSNTTLNTRLRNKLNGVTEENFNAFKSIVDSTLLDASAATQSASVYIRKGEYEYFKSTGFVDVSDSIPVTNDTIFNIVSTGKIFCAILVEHFIELGYMQRQDPICNYLNDFSGVLFVNENIDVSFSGNSITIADCLKEECGLGYMDASGYHWAPNAPAPNLGQFLDSNSNNIDLSASNLYDWVKRIIDNGVATSAIGESGYGAGHTILGLLCEFVYAKNTQSDLSNINYSDISYNQVDKKLDELLNQFIFTPCDASMGFNLSSNPIQLPVLFSGYPSVLDDGSKGRILDTTTPYSNPTSNVMSAGDGMCMSINSFSKVMNMLMNHGVSSNGTRVVSTSVADIVLNFTLNEPNSKSGPLGPVSLVKEENFMVYAHGITKYFIPLDGGGGTIFGLVPSKKSGLRYWVGLTSCLNCLWVNDDAQIICIDHTRTLANADLWQDLANQFTNIWGA